MRFTIAQQSQDASCDVSIQGKVLIDVNLHLNNEGIFSSIDESIDQLCTELKTKLKKLCHAQRPTNTKLSITFPPMHFVLESNQNDQIMIQSLRRSIAQFDSQWLSIGDFTLNEINEDIQNYSLCCQRSWILELQQCIHKQSFENTKLIKHGRNQQIEKLLQTSQLSCQQTQYNGQIQSECLQDKTLFIPQLKLAQDLRQNRGNQSIVTSKQYSKVLTGKTCDDTEENFRSMPDVSCFQSNNSQNIQVSLKTKIASLVLEDNFEIQEQEENMNQSSIQYDIGQKANQNKKSLNDSRICLQQNQNKQRNCTHYNLQTQNTQMVINIIENLTMGNEKISNEETQKRMINQISAHNLKNEDEIHSIQLGKIILQKKRSISKNKRKSVFLIDQVQIREQDLQMRELQIENNKQIVSLQNILPQNSYEILKEQFHRFFFKSYVSQYSKLEREIPQKDLNIRFIHLLQKNPSIEIFIRELLNQEMFNEYFEQFKCKGLTFSLINKILDKGLQNIKIQRLFNQITQFVGRSLQIIDRIEIKFKKKMKEIDQPQKFNFKQFLLWLLDRTRLMIENRIKLKFKDKKQMLNHFQKQKRKSLTFQKFQTSIQQINFDPNIVESQDILRRQIRKIDRFLKLFDGTPHDLTVVIQMVKISFKYLVCSHYKSMLKYFRQLKGQQNTEEPDQTTQLQRQDIQRIDENSQTLITQQINQMQAFHNQIGVIEIDIDDYPSVNILQGHERIVSNMRFNWRRLMREGNSRN